MAEIIDDIAHLTQKIGPHPAGTEEEQQAALYLAEELQKDAGFSTIIEDFQCVNNSQIPTFIVFGAALIAGVLSLIVPTLGLVCFIVALVVAALQAAELMGKPLLSRLFRMGASQNVVAKYQPTPKGGVARRRKVILVANYDTGKVLFEEKPPIATVLPVLQKVCMGALAATPLVMFFRSVVFAADTGAVSSVLSFLLVICLILLVLPLVRAALHVVAPLSPGANNNAAGVSVLLDVARQIGQGLVSDEEAAARAAQESGVVHGAEAARASGVVPDGVKLEYDAPLSSQESLAAAKAAIAAMTGKPVADKVPVTDISSRLVKGGGLEPEDEVEATSVHFEVSEPSKPRTITPRAKVMKTQAAEEEKRMKAELAEKEALEEARREENLREAAAREAEEALRSYERPPLSDAAPAPSYSFGGSSTPAWARKAQEKARANKPDSGYTPSVGRSRYADAPAAHMTGSFGGGSGHDYAGMGNGFDGVDAPSELSARLVSLHEEITSTPAPTISEETHEAIDHMVVEAPASPEPETAAFSSDRFNLAEQGENESAKKAKEESPAPSSPSASEERPVEPAVDSREEFVGEPIDSAPETSGAPVARDVEMPTEQESPERDHSSVRIRRPKSRDLAGRFSRAVNARRSAEKVDELPEPISVESKEPSAEEPEPSKTTAIAPIDVSAFLDKEQEAPEREIVTFPSYLNEDVQDDFGTEQVDSEQTQRVSSEAIQEAIHEASSREVSLTERDPELTSAPLPASPIIGMESMIPSVDTAERPKKKQVIVLPDVSAVASSDDQKQRAPMAVASQDTKAGTKSLLSNMLPSIGGTGSFGAVPEKEDAFGRDLPPISADDVPRQAVSVTGSFSTVGSTGSFTPVGDELVADIDPEERYVDDADDEVYDDEYTQTGAFAGDGYVDMPKSRAGRFFGRFRSKKKKQHEESSVHEWVGADEDYNARSVGKARGDWSSFRQDEADSFDQADEFIDVDYRKGPSNDRDWNGGAFSLDRLRQVKDGIMKKDAPAEDAIDLLPEELEYDDQFHGEEPSIGERGQDHPLGEKEAVEHIVYHPYEPAAVDQLNRELKKLQDFRHPDIDTEVWFVALGGEQYSHSGMQAFLEQHADEMRGAIVINLEALGAGSLCCIEKEGAFKSYSPSSRSKRFLRQASERTGVSFRNASITSRDTSATVAMSRGIQALTIAGIGDNNTALYSSENDVIENIDEDMLNHASSFVMGVLKSI